MQKQKKNNFDPHTPPESILPLDGYRQSGGMWHFVAFWMYVWRNLHERVEGIQEEGDQIERMWQ